MSKYSEYSSVLTLSANGITDISGVLFLLRNIKRKREEPVAAYVGNKNSNVNLANQMTELARERYDLALQDIERANLISTEGLPSFNDLKDIAETAEARDR